MFCLLLSVYCDYCCYLYTEVLALSLFLLLLPLLSSLTLHCYYSSRRCKFKARDAEVLLSSSSSIIFSSISSTILRDASWTDACAVGALGTGRRGEAVVVFIYYNHNRNGHCQYHDHMLHFYNYHDHSDALEVEAQDRDMGASFIAAFMVLILIRIRILVRVILVS